MTEAEHDLAAFEISEQLKAYVKYITNPDVNSLVRIVMPLIKEQFKPSKQEYFHLLSTAKRLAGDAIRDAQKQSKQKKK